MPAAQQKPSGMRGQQLWVSLWISGYSFLVLFQRGVILFSFKFTPKKAKENPATLIIINNNNSPTTVIIINIILQRHRYHARQRKVKVNLGNFINAMHMTKPIQSLNGITLSLLGYIPHLWKAKTPPPSSLPFVSNLPSWPQPHTSLRRTTPTTN